MSSFLIKVGKRGKRERESERGRQSREQERGARGRNNALNLDLDPLLKKKKSAFALTPAPNTSSSSSPAGFAALIPGNSPAEIVFTSGISSFLSLYNATIIGRLLLSWWPQAPQAIVSPLATLTDPYLNLFRGLIPPLGGTIDLSPILAFVTLDLLTSSAAALPCEMPTETVEGKGKGKGKGKGLAPRRVAPRAGRWGVPSLVAAAAASKRRSQQQEQQ